MSKDALKDTMQCIARFRPRDAASKANLRMAVKNDVGEIYLYDSIGMWGVTAQQFTQDLKGLGKVKKIDLHINSDGGDVFDGRAIYTQLAQHSARITCYVDGLAASIASLIAMAGDEIRMADGSYMMIHKAWGLCIGNDEEMRTMADLLQSVSDTIADTYAARTKCPLDNVKAMMAAETWMTAKEAKDKGFCDVVDEPVRAAAALRDPDIFLHAPAALLPKRAAALARIDALRR